jgi:hypothetical protein
LVDRAKPRHFKLANLTPINAGSSGYAYHVDWEPG